MNICKATIISAVALSAASLLHAKPWWERPVRIGYSPVIDNNYDGPLSPDFNGGYYAFPVRMASGPFNLYRFSDLLNGYFDSPVYSLTNSSVRGYYTDFQLRGAALNSDQSRVLVGSYTGAKMLSLPLEAESVVVDQPGASDPNAFIVTNSIGITPDFFRFSKDGKSLYCSAQGSAFRTNVYVFSVGDLTGPGGALTHRKTIPVGQRVRNSAYAVVNGREIFYVLLDKKLGVKAVDVESGEVTTILENPLAESSSYGAIAVTGTAARKPRLTIFHEDSGAIGSIEVFDLTPDGKHLASEEPVYKASPGIVGTSLLNYSRTGNGVSLNITDDESTMLIGCGCSFSLVCYKPEVRVVNVGEKADVSVDASGFVLPGTEISGRVSRCHRLFTPHIYVGGKKIALDDRGYFRFTAGATAEIVVTYTYKYAWYSDPALKNSIVDDFLSYTPWGGILDEANGRYFAIAACNSFSGGESGIVQYNAAELISSRKDNQKSVNSTFSYFEKPMETTRDITYSPEYNVVLSSGMSPSTNTIVAHPVGGMWNRGEDDSRYCVTNDLNRRLWPAAFGHGSEFFYAIHDTAPETPAESWSFPGPKSTNPALAKFRTVADSEGRLVAFEFVEDIVTDNLPQTSDYDCYVGVVRTFYDAARNRDIVYIAGRDGLTAVDTSTTPPTVVNNWFENPGPWDETYPSFNIIGTERDTPRVVLNRSSAGLGVYQLMPDLMTLASTEPVASFTRGSAPFSSLNLGSLALGYCGFGASADEKFLFFSAPSMPGSKLTLFLLTSGHVLDCYPETRLIFR